MWMSFHLITCCEWILSVGQITKWNSRVLSGKCHGMSGRMHNIRKSPLGQSVHDIKRQFKIIAKRGNTTTLKEIHKEQVSRHISCIQNCIANIKAKIKRSLWKHTLYLWIHMTCKEINSKYKRFKETIFHPTTMFLFIFLQNYALVKLLYQFQWGTDLFLRYKELINYDMID